MIEVAGVCLDNDRSTRRSRAGTDGNDVILYVIDEVYTV